VPEIVYILLSGLYSNRNNLFVASLDVPVGIRLMPPLQSSFAKEEFPINADKSYDSISSKGNGDAPPFPLSMYTHAHTAIEGFLMHN
jgi:hypothetical protein